MWMYIFLESQHGGENGTWSKTAGSLRIVGCMPSPTLDERPCLKELRQKLRDQDIQVPQHVNSQTCDPHVSVYKHLIHKYNLHKYTLTE